MIALIPVSFRPRTHCGFPEEEPCVKWSSGTLHHTSFVTSYSGDFYIDREGYFSPVDSASGPRSPSLIESVLQFAYSLSVPYRLFTHTKLDVDTPRSWILLLFGGRTLRADHRLFNRSTVSHPASDRSLYSGDILHLQAKYILTQGVQYSATVV